ncbi:MAG TPA: tyrosine--tRNA ligase [Exilispira sp.]|nr:tyrosine--tRNA ligase [Spirochaetota bacterium]HQJ41199.1 tyrosine--tRNA ligase [Exilispira sp.]HQM89056.1 tyrosine--tRNA ligase [Exilispira sp.]HQQ18464.1 tyrosine--tRNA ligase [Exilispira sp.]
MKKGLFKTLKERGFVEQETCEDLDSILDQKPMTCYIGFDPTASSLHIGSLEPIMLLKWFEKFGHKPIAVIGTGTAMVGDPSGKTEMRKMLTKEQIFSNAEGIRKNLNQFLSFSENAHTEGTTKIRYNSDWLLNLNYIDFLREIGVYFSVNKMLSFESYKIRLEKGLSFIEFNYQVMQAYDFLKLFEQEDCKMQMGGADQWGNIVAGIDLIRRIHQKEAYAFTAPLIMTANGEKMGKSAGNAVWLDSNLLKPYDYYQYWINIDDKDVKRFLKLFTFLDIEFIEDLTRPEKNINEAKQILAFEATKLAHGEDEANKAKKGAKIFSKNIDEETLDLIPTCKIQKNFSTYIVDILVESGLVSSKSEAKRLIEQKGVYVDDFIIPDIKYQISIDNLKKDYIIIRVGKKKYKKVIFV